DTVVNHPGGGVSGLALSVRPHDKRIEGFVLEAGSGEPIREAEIMSWHLDQQGDRVADGPPLRSDENGFFTFPGSPQRPSLVRARAQLAGTWHELGSMQEYWSQPVPKMQPFSQTLFFTDRALYRPGQTIQYKGICVRVAQEQDNSDVIAGAK